MIQTDHFVTWRTLAANNTTNVRHLDDDYVHFSCPCPNYNIPSRIASELTEDLFFQPIGFNDHVVPICLGPEEDTPAGTKCWATGFGSVNHNIKDPVVSDTLKEVDLDISSRSYCRNAFFGMITDKMICANNKKKGACSGDSGGPLVCRGPDGAFRLHGAASFVSGT